MGSFIWVTEEEEVLDLVTDECPQSRLSGCLCISYEDGEGKNRGGGVTLVLEGKLLWLQGLSKFSQNERALQSGFSL